MTVDEIKQTTTMRDVLAKYGVEVNIHGMCKCPIHGERHPSMKVFPDGYKCFACGSGGDIFRFVQDMEKCDFKQAFILLGGTYEHESTKKQKLVKAKYARRKGKREQQASFNRQFRDMLENAIFRCRYLIACFEPFSDEWCELQNGLPWLQYVWDLKYLYDEEINKADVIRMCKRIERIGHFV